MEKYVKTLSKGSILGVDLLKIFVMLGTQRHSFRRLLLYIEKTKVDAEITVQAGFTKYKSKKMCIFDFVNAEELNKYIKEADIIITHGGTGSIITSLKMKKKVIACARLKKYHEHIDNHQTELVSLFAEEGYVLELNENSNLDFIIERIKTFTPKVYISNTNNFIKQLIVNIEN